MRKYYTIAPIFVDKNLVEICCLKEELGHGETVPNYGNPLEEPFLVQISLSVTPDGQKYAIKSVVLEESTVGPSTARDLAQAIVDNHDAALAKQKAEWKKQMEEHSISDEMEHIIDVLTAEQLTALDTNTKTKYDNKKALRASEPV